MTAATIIVESKQQAARAVVSITMLLPLLLLLGLALAFHHFNLMTVARVLPACGLFIAVFAAMNFLNPGSGRQ